MIVIGVVAKVVLEKKVTVTMRRVARKQSIAISAKQKCVVKNLKRTAKESESASDESDNSTNDGVVASQKEQSASVAAKKKKNAPLRPPTTDDMPAYEKVYNERVLPALLNGNNMKTFLVYFGSTGANYRGLREWERAFVDTKRAEMERTFDAIRLFDMYFDSYDKYTSLAEPLATAIYIYSQSIEELAERAMLKINMIDFANDDHRAALVEFIKSFPTNDLRLCIAQCESVLRGLGENPKNDLLAKVVRDAIVDDS